MSALDTALRYHGELYLPCLLQRGEKLIILLPPLKPCLIDLVCHLKLCIKICRIHLAGEIGGTIVHPSVLIYLSPEIFTPVCSLFPKDLRCFDIFVITDQKRAALTHAEIFGLVKAEAPEISDGAKRLSLIAAHDCLCRILHHQKMMPSCNVHDRVHLTGNACVMNHCNHLCSLCNCRLDQGFINVHGIRTDIHKYRRCPAKHKGVCRRDKGIGGKNHLIPFFDIAKKRRHLQGMCAGGGKKTFPRAGQLFQIRTALFGELSVSADMLILYCLLHIFHFPSCIGRDIKTNHTFLSFRLFPGFDSFIHKR